MKKWSLAFLVFSSAVVLATAHAAQSTQAKIEGKGDCTSEVVPLKKGLLIVGAAHKGDRNFVVQLLSTDGEKSDLLVNAIGDYQGVRLIPVEAGRYRFQVRANQAWVSMSPDELLAEILRLPRPQRAKVAEELLASLEEPNDEVAAAWAEELERRSRALAGGHVQTIPWDRTRPKF